MTLRFRETNISTMLSRAKEVAGDLRRTLRQIVRRTPTGADLSSAPQLF